MSVSSRSCHSSRDAATECVSVADGLCRPKTAAVHGRFWNFASNTAVDDHHDELVDLMRWLKIDRFERRAVNRQLAQLGLSAPRATA
jgi:hypothetical protein